ERHRQRTRNRKRRVIARQKRHPRGLEFRLQAVLVREDRLKPELQPVRVPAACRFAFAACAAGHALIGLIFSGLIPSFAIACCTTCGLTRPFWLSRYS